VSRWEPPREQVVEAAKPRRWPTILLLMAILGVAVAGLWMIRRQLRPPPMGNMAEAEDVRSVVSVVGDSLEVVVQWRLADSAGARPDSVRVEVGLGDGRESFAATTPSSQSTDTLRLRAPTAGETVAGYSCAAPMRGGRLARERCTPWQYVRPSAQAPTRPGEPDSAKSPRSKRETAASHAAAVVRIVIAPEGQQVDPDVGGRCAAWQRRNPERSVWIEVNQEAIPECMGPNGKPTVAKFCAFAVLADGRRIKTENSSNDAYCERLFQAWVRQRVT
jgi:hypothetical protein